MKLLSISDRQFVFLKSPSVEHQFDAVDFIISCGDLPYYYLEAVSETLHKPLFFVRGNHDHEREYHADGVRTGPRGCFDLHRRIISWQGVFLAGGEGSVRYKSSGKFQSTQGEMWEHVLSLAPHFLWNRLVHGRALDIFVSHAPPWKIHDKNDLTHQGIKAFRWLIKVFKPKYLFHGHIHVYKTDTQTKTRVEDTLVINAYGYRETDLRLD